MAHFNQINQIIPMGEETGIVHEEEKPPVVSADLVTSEFVKNVNNIILSRKHEARNLDVNDFAKVVYNDGRFVGVLINYIEKGLNQMSLIEETCKQLEDQSKKKKTANSTEKNLNVELRELQKFCIKLVQNVELTQDEKAKFSRSLKPESAEKKQHFNLLDQSDNEVVVVISKNMLKDLIQIALNHADESGHFQVEKIKGNRFQIQIFETFRNMFNVETPLSFDTKTKFIEHIISLIGNFVE